MIANEPMDTNTVTAEASSDASLGRITIRSLFTWTLFVAFPLACFRQYYALASDTADQRTTPLLQATPIAMLFFASGVVSVLVIISFFAMRRKYASAMSVVIALTLCTTLGYPWFKSGVMEPKNGNPQAAQLHNDAAALTAVAVKFYYQRNCVWPKTWSDLDDYLSEALLAQQARSINRVNSAPNLSPALTNEQLPELVDVDFSAAPETLSKQAWFEFTGIRPHKPSYNLFRQEFQELIKVLGAQKGTSKSAIQ